MAKLIPSKKLAKFSDTPRPPTGRAKLISNSAVVTNNVMVKSKYASYLSSKTNLVKAKSMTKLPIITRETKK